jgi:SAM-dependent methyltransferase
MVAMVPHGTAPDPSAPSTPYIGAEGTRPYQGASWFYARYRPKLSDGFIDLVTDRLRWGATDRVLDLGTGPGQVALRLAPKLAEVVGIDPEPDQIEEARRQAEAQRIQNVRFLVGGSDDLPSLAPRLGQFRAATMAESFHWMLDRDRVLRVLSGMVDPTHGAVLLITTGVSVSVEEPLARARRTVRRVLEKHLEGVPPGPHPRGRHDPFEAILLRSPFPALLLLRHEYDVAVTPEPERVVFAEYTLSHVLRRLGERRKAFEDEAFDALKGFAAGGLYKERLRDSALVGRRRAGNTTPSR